MISRGIESATKSIQSNWDLTSSATGTVKRRPSSQESCKSNSPTKSDAKSIDFPEGKEVVVAKEVVSASCKINKPLKLNENASDLSQEIAGGSSSGNGETANGSWRKINKNRFFDLKLKKSFTSKLKLPNRVSLTLSPRKTSPHNKLSLSQLERQNNLFIRDGQQANESLLGDGEKINKHEPSEVKNNIILGSRKQNASPDIAMEKAESNNPKQKQESSEGGSKMEMARNKKSSLIPAFLGGNAKATNHIKIPTASGSIKKVSSTTVVEKLTKTGNKFKELYRDFPSGGESSTNSSRSSLKRNPPPYRPPPPANKQTQSNVERQKRIRVSENDARNYEEIDVISEENVDDKDKRVAVCDDNQSSSNHNDDIANARSEDNERRVEEDIECMMSKAEYSSNMFKNIPVRQKKGAVSHIENYCLFDPSVDFCNEKELMKKKLAQARMSEINEHRQHPSKSFQLNVSSEENIEDATFEDHTVYDISELDEREQILAHHNYYEIDPDLLLQEEEENAVPPMPSQNDGSRKIYGNTLSTSSESTSASQTSSNSSSTATSSDYPSLFNSVIETTHSSALESTDENESNGYGTVKTLCGETINQVNVTAVANESVIIVSNTTVTCGVSNASTTGTTKKKSPQLNRIIRPSSSSSSRNVSQKQSNKQQTSSLVAKNKAQSKINLAFSNKSVQSDALKSSHSLPQLKNRSRQTTDVDFMIENTICLRRQPNSRSARPLSGNSDDRDSGFLSPVTPPDTQYAAAHITPNVIVKEPEASTKTESTVLNQCDSVQQLIEVSNRNDRCVTYEHFS